LVKNLKGQNWEGALYKTEEEDLILTKASGLEAYWVHERVCILKADDVAWSKRPATIN
jgi:hypothetical protein